MSDERAKRWRLVLGEPAREPFGGAGALEASDAQVDAVLGALYDGKRGAGLGASAPAAVRWLGDIREYFPTSVVRVMQHDALERLGLRRMLLEPELLSAVTPDVPLVATLLALGGVMPERTRETARAVVRTVVDDVERRLAQKLVAAVRGSLDRARRSRRPRHAEIDWRRTIAANLAHYRPEYRTVVVERLVGYARRGSSLREVVLCIDQSGSMATSVVYAGIFGAVLASIRALRTTMIVFDTEVVDLSEALHDPIELLFGTQLGGGTDIARAIAYARQGIRAPGDTILILISDLFEGGDRGALLRRMASLVAAGVTVVVLLALDDRGAPSYDATIAAALAALGIPAFACTPDRFPELLAAAIERRDLAAWATGADIAVAT